MTSKTHFFTALTVTVLTLGTVAGCVWSASLLATSVAVLAADYLSGYTCAEATLGY